MSWIETTKFAAMVAGTVGIPLLGCALAVIYKDTKWLVLLAPLVVFMEGAFILVPLAWFITSILIEMRQ